MELWYQYSIGALGLYLYFQHLCRRIFKSIEIVFLAKYKPVKLWAKLATFFPGELRDNQNYRGKVKKPDLMF